MPNIGSLSFSTRIVSAPLCGISDYPFRQLLRSFGIELTYSEMVSSIALAKGSLKTLSGFFVKDEPLTSVQLFGNDPDAFMIAASYFEEQGASTIDINLGCSVKKILRQGAGSALQRDLTLVKRILQAVRKSIKIPLTIKCRLGWSPSEENYIDLLRIAQDSGVDAFCLHPRYAIQLFTGKSDWTKFFSLADLSSIPLIGSGDIICSDDVHKAFQEYPVDFVMLGRGLLGNPWIISDYLGFSRLSVLDTIQKHFELLCDYYPEKKAALLFRKFISRYVRGMPNAQELRMLGNQITSLSDFRRFIQNFHV